MKKTHCNLEDKEVTVEECLNCTCALKECREKRAFFKEEIEKGEVI